MPEKINFNNENNDDLNEELKEFLKDLNKKDIKIQAKSLERFSRASVLRKMIKEWINEGKIKENDNISILLKICEVEESTLPSKIKTVKEEKLQRRIEVIRDQMDWFKKEINSKNLSIKELLDQLESIIKEEKDFLYNSQNNLNE
jgi:hypothetical protein